ncbi:MAG: hypothetical protein ACI4XL_10950, partial [Bacillus sp. (in: firmicutes)]
SINVFPHSKTLLWQYFSTCKEFGQNSNSMPKQPFEKIDCRTLLSLFKGPVVSFFPFNKNSKDL